MKAWQFLPSFWNSFALPTNIQKRLYKFLLRKAIGQFLAKELDLDNFDIELYNGSVELRDLDLNLETLNDCIADTPFVLVEGKVGSITASLPWSNLASGIIALKVQGLQLTLRPVKTRRKSRNKEDDDPPIMSSSLHFADDFLRTEMEDQELMDSIQKSMHISTSSSSDRQGDVDIGMEGLQVLTRVIDKMLAKVKVDVIDTTVRILHKSAAPPSPHHDEYYLDLQIARISYFDETPEFNKPSSQQPLDESSIHINNNNNNNTIKIITLSSPSIWIRSKNNGPLYSIPTNSETRLHNDDDENSDLEQTEFYEANEGLYGGGSNSIHSSFMSGSTTPRAYGAFSTSSNNTNKPYEALLFTMFDKENWIRVQMRPSYPLNPTRLSDHTSAIKQIDILCSHIRTMITPRQAAFLADLLKHTMDAMTDTSSSSSSTSESSTPDMTTSSIPRMDSILLSQSSSPDLGFDRIRSPPRLVIPNMTTPSSTTTSSSAASTSASSVPDIKIKFQINEMEFYFLVHDGPDLSPPPPSMWETNDCNGCKEIGHIRLAIRELVARYQQFPDNSNNAQRKDESTLAAASSLLSTFDIKVKRMSVDEWIRRPSFEPWSSKKAAAERAWQIPYERYLPILEFDDSIMHDYRHDTQFPSIVQSHATHRIRSHHHHRRDKTHHHEVIRIRVEKKHAHQSRRFVNATSLEENTQITIMPLKIHVDPQVADRFENYVYAMMELTEKWDKPTRPQEMSNLDSSLGQRIYEDLDRGSTKRQHCKSASFKCGFIRILLYVPDMSQVCVRDEFNDLLHSDILSVDIKQFGISWKSEGDGGQEEPTSAHTPFQGMNLGTTSNLDAPIKLQAECDFINVFLKQAHDTASRCWFTAKTIPPQEPDTFSTTSTVAIPQAPTFEITVRLSDSMHAPTVPAAKSGYFGSGSDIPNNLFEHLNKNESLDASRKPHVPMEDQTESAMMFKQRTVETSLFVVNCHFPSTRMNLAKEVWDTVQILQNDLLLWQPKFISRVQAAKQGDKVSGDSFVRRSGDYDAAGSSLRASSILSQSHERLGYLTHASSLLSLIAVMSDARWDLHWSSKDKTNKASYRVRMSEFRYFTVVKHLGTDENVTTLDIDELTLDQIVPFKRPILYKTISGELSPKRNTAMISVFAKLFNDYALNKQHKITSVVACNLCWRFSMDLDFIEQLVDFQKTPEEMVFIDPPTQYNKVYAHILDTSIDYKPIHLPSRAVIVIDDFQIITDIVSSGQPIISIKTFLERLDVMLVDDDHDIDDQHLDHVFGHRGSTCVSAKEYWSNLGFPSVISVVQFDALIKAKLDDLVLAPNLEVTIFNNVLVLEGCTDSFHSLINFVTYVANQGDLDTEQQQQQQQTKEDHPKRKTKAHGKQPIVTKHRSPEDNPDMLASLDPDAFRRITANVMSSASSSSSSSRPQSNVLDLGYVEGYYSTEATRPPPQKPRRRHAAQHPNMATKNESACRLLMHDLDELVIVENFYSTDKQVMRAGRPGVDTSRSLLSLRIHNFDIVWNLYDGYEFKYMRSMRSSSASSRPTSSSSIDSRLSRANSIDAGSSSYGSPTDLFGHSPDDIYYDDRHHQHQHQHQQRYPTPDIEMHVNGVSVELDLMPETERTGIHFVLDVRDFEVIDNVKTSSWSKFLGYMRPDSHSLPRERGSMMLHVDLQGIRPIDQDPTLEFRVKLKLLPLRLYVDQDALNFMVKYFTFDKNLLHSTTYANDAIKMPATEEADADEEEEEDDQQQEVFLQSVEIHPIVLKIDYKPKYVNYGNIKEGQFAELVNLFRLDEADIELSHVKLTGINGFTRLADRLMREWLPHIKNTQVPHMLSGVAPIRPFVNLGNGVADLVLLPIQQYRKDGRIMRGLQKGTQAFARATAMEAIKLSARFASGAQVILEQADDFFSSSSSTSSTATSRREQVVTDAIELFEDEEGYIYATTVPSKTTPLSMQQQQQQQQPTLSKFAHQPSDLTQGFQYAYQSLSRNLGAAAETIFAVPTEVVGEDNGHHAKAVIRAVPVAVIKPMIGLTGAFHSIMVGLRNSIDPNMRLQNQDKYKR